MTVHVRSTGDGWLGTFVGSGSRDVSGVAGDVYLRTRDNQVVTDTPCTALPHPVDDVVCELSGSIVSWTAPDDVTVHVRSTVDGWLATNVGSGTDNISGVEGDIFTRTRANGAIHDTACTASPLPVHDVVCELSGSVVSWTAPDDVTVHVRSTVDGWLGSYDRPSTLDVSDVSGEIFVRTRVNKIVLDTPCE